MNLLNSQLDGVAGRVAKRLHRAARPVFLALAVWAAVVPGGAFPPAPHHLIYGLVRDEWGNPLNVTDAEVTLETASGSKTSTIIVPNLAPGVNYQLAVPMDSGITSDLYKPTALRPEAPFRLKVRIGQTIYLPIEMKGDFAQLGRSGKTTRLDLTLGEDSDGDGLPDAWERALIALGGGKLTLKDINPGDDFDHDGLSNLAEYLAGTYAFDDKNGFALKIARVHAAAAVLQFTAVRGRTYVIHASADLQSWTPVTFRLPADDTTDFPRASYLATDVAPLEVEVALPPEGQPARFFKLMVQ